MEYKESKGELFRRLRMVTLQELVKRSHGATCGAFEREVVVKRENAARAILLIKKSGFRFIGSGPAGIRGVKIWFIRRGLAGL